MFPSSLASYKNNIRTFYYEKPKMFLNIYLIIFFFMYFIIDFINTHYLNFYPIYKTIWADGVADIIFFKAAGELVLRWKFDLLFSSYLDVGIVAPFIYSIPVGISEISNLNMGFCFRIFYLILYLLTGKLLYEVINVYYQNMGLKVAFLYLLNPFIFFLDIWIGSEEVIEAFFLILIIYFYAKGKIHYALIIASFAVFYKYYTLIMIPTLIFSIKDKKIRNLVFGGFIFVFLLAFTFLTMYFSLYFQSILDFFIFEFPLRGKGLFRLFLELELLTFVDSNGSILYFSLMILILSLTTIIIKDSKKPFKFGLLFLIFFLLYPVFFSAYLLVVMPLLYLLIPLQKNNLLKYSYLLVFNFTFLSEFAFSVPDSIYAYLGIQIMPELVMFGAINLVIVYLIMIIWIIFTLQAEYNQREDRNFKIDNISSSSS